MEYGVYFFYWQHYKRAMTVWRHGCVDTLEPSTKGPNSGMCYSLLLALFDSAAQYTGNKISTNE